MAELFAHKKLMVAKREQNKQKTPNITIAKKTLPERHGIKYPQKSGK